MKRISKTELEGALRRKQTAISRAWTRIMAAHLTITPKRYIELIREAGQILDKEMKRESRSKR